MTEAPGVGAVIATAVVATVGDARLFNSGRGFAASLGLTPRQHATGGKERLLGISKRGDGYLRRQLMALILILDAPPTRRRARFPGGNLLDTHRVEGGRAVHCSVRALPVQPPKHMSKGGLARLLHRYVRVFSDMTRLFVSGL